MNRKTLEIFTQKSQETEKAGLNFAKKLLKSRNKEAKALVLGLIGELGRGKTTFVQGMARGFKIKEAIISPSFVILKRYQIPETNLWFCHIDCYRIDQSQDLIDLDFEEMLNSFQNIITIEWADRVKNILPDNTFWIKFEYLGPDKRKIII